MANMTSLWLTSGGRTGIFSRWHSATEPATLSWFSMRMSRTAAMYSTG